MADTLPPQNQPFDPMTVMKDLSAQLAQSLLEQSIDQARAAYAYEQLAKTQDELNEALRAAPTTPAPEPEAPKRR